MIPYAAKIYSDYLEGTRGIQVFRSKPATRPPKCIVLTTIPAGPTAKPMHLAWRRLVIQCWDRADASGDAAGQLAEEIRQDMVDSMKAGLLGVHKVVIVGEPGRFDDPNEATPRFQLTVDVLMRANFRQ